jgi:serine/threonine protein phosphatase PrpC
MVIVDSAGLSDVGKKRKGNEDSLYIDDDLRVYVVADGMGGHKAGEVASKLVVNTMRDYLKQFQNGSDVDELPYQDKTLSTEANRLVSSVHLSNRVVYQVSNSKPSCRGMGSTVSAVAFTNDTIIATNVGDSPTYLIRNNNVQTLSVLHTVIAEQMALNPDAPHIDSSFNHMLTRAMGIEKTVKPDVCEIQCFKGDILVIASDGLTDKVSPREILNVANNKNPEKAVRTLVQMANDRGGDDNITVIVLKVKAVKNKQGGIGAFFSRFFK